MKIIRMSVLIILALFIGTIHYPAEASFLEDTAGISASVTLSPVDLTVALTVFKNIEQQDSTYIVGSVALENYGEDHDVHVYITNTGHTIAYYLNTEPVCKIIDWKGYSGGDMTLAGSKLEDALNQVCIVIGQTLPAVTYFDFRYPTATHFKIIADEKVGSSGTEIYRYYIPSNHNVINASWSFALNKMSTANTYSRLLIDGSELCRITNPPNDTWRYLYGTIEPQYLTQDVFHEVSIYAGNSYYYTYAAMVFVYSE